MITNWFGQPDEIRKYCPVVHQMRLPIPSGANDTRLVWIFPACEIWGYVGYVSKAHIFLEWVVWRRRDGKTKTVSEEGAIGWLRREQERAIPRVPEWHAELEMDL